MQRSPLKDAAFAPKGCSVRPQRMLRSPPKDASFAPEGCNVCPQRMQRPPPRDATFAPKGCSVRPRRMQRLPPKVAASAPKGCFVRPRRMQRFPSKDATFASEGCGGGLLQSSPPTPLNFSTKAEIFSNTVFFFVLYFGLSGLIFGSVALSAVPFSVAYSRFSDALM